jgi:hypothetical protein
LQIAAAGAVVLTTWLLARFLGGRSGCALLYGACPAVALEAANVFALLSWLPELWRMPVALALAACCAVLAVVRSSREPVLVTCCWLYGCSFLIATPIYPWYALPFVVLVIMAGRLEWLSVWAALYVAFVFVHETLIQALAFGTALAVVASVGFRRWNRTRRQSLAQETQPHAAPNPQNLTAAQPPSRGSRATRELPTRLE